MQNTHSVGHQSLAADLHSRTVRKGQEEKRDSVKHHRLSNRAKSSA